MKSAKFLKWVGGVPTLSLRDGSEVPDDVVKGFLALAMKAEAPDGSQIADGILASLAPESAARFGQWVLEQWIAFDIAPPDRAAIQKKKLAQLRAVLEPISDADFVAHPHYAATLAGYRGKKYANSGWTSRGVLALAAKAPARQAAQVAWHFIDKHARRHGVRSAQGKAVLRLLARIGDGNCLEVLTRTAAGQHDGLAGVAAEGLERVRIANGWSRGELGDRAVSSAGLDDSNGIDLPWDDKSYRAELTDTLEIVLRNPSGKAVKALPAAKNDAQKEVRKTLADIRKNVSSSVDAQTARLYAEMCHSRRWPVPDWRSFVLDHPIVGRLAERVVWVADEGGSFFRPTPEGDFTDVEDVPVNLGPASQVLIAHWSMPGLASEAWLRHFADYDVQPLFNQLAPRQAHIPPRLDVREIEFHFGVDGPRQAFSWTTGRCHLWGPDLMARARALGYHPPGTGKSFWEFPNLQKTIGEVRVLVMASGTPPSTPGNVGVGGITTSVHPDDMPALLRLEIINDLAEMTGQDLFHEVVA